MLARRVERLAVVALVVPRVHDLRADPAGENARYCGRWALRRSPGQTVHDIHTAVVAIAL